MDVSCRRCREQPETLGHVLGQCVYTTPARIRRHDDLVDFLADKLSRKGTIIKEPTITDRGELKKPDLVFHRDGIVKVLDVTVVYEKDNYLAHEAQVKKDKYKGSSEILRRQLIGSRGTIPRDMTNALRHRIKRYINVITDDVTLVHRDRSHVPGLSKRSWVRRRGAVELRNNYL